MFRLNLLPPAEKTNLAYALRSRAVAAVGGALVISLSLSTVLLLPTVFLLGFQTSEVVRAVDLEKRHHEEIGVAARLELVSRANRVAELAAQHETERVTISPLLADILRSVPPGMRLDRLRFRADTGELGLDGTAVTRSELLAFTAALGAHPRLADVTSPVTNLIRETNVKFSLRATVRPAPATP